MCVSFKSNPVVKSHCHKHVILHPNEDIKKIIKIQDNKLDNALIEKKSFIIKFLVDIIDFFVILPSRTKTIHNERTSIQGGLLHEDPGQGHGHLWT